MDGLGLRVYRGEWQSTATGLPHVVVIRHTHTHRGWHRYIHTHNDETTLENVGQDSCYGSMDRIDLYIDE